MSEKQERPAFNFKELDWDAYVQYRPIYPEELYSEIYAYHDSHQGKYDSAVDIGAGAGIVSAQLVKKFSHVTVTDPAEAYVSAAKKLFATYPPEHIDFLQTKAEEVSLDRLPKGEKVDLVTAAECLHWADVEVASSRFASILKSGGTFAGWLYSVRPLLAEQSGDLAKAREIFYDIYQKMCDRYDELFEKQDETSGGAAMNARLDHMPFSPDTWTNVRRIHNNTKEPMVNAGWPTWKSRVSEDEKVEKFEKEDLLFHSADYEYLEGYLVNWIPPVKVKEFAKDELARLKEVMGGQKINVTWVAVLVLATRK